MMPHLLNTVTKSSIKFTGQRALVKNHFPLPVDQLPDGTAQGIFLVLIRLGMFY